MATWAQIYRAEVPPGARISCVNLHLYGDLATHTRARENHIPRQPQNAFCPIFSVLD